MSPGVFVFATLAGLLVGSFLGLIAHRLPVMLEHAWQRYCRSLETQPASSTSGASPPAEDHATQTYNLLRPASHCPTCGHLLSPLENIPLLSWLFLRGRCRQCRAFIGWREPVVEVAAAAASVLAVWRFGLDWDGLWAAVFLWALIVASVIDLQRGWLPDELTQPLLWLGLLVNLDGRFVAPEDAVVGAAAGFVALWMLARGYRLLTRRDGLGDGDLHLLAAIGAWVGWQPLAGVLLVAALLGLCAFGVAAIAFGRSARDPQPFGPMLAVGGLIALVWPEWPMQALTWAPAP